MKLASSRSYWVTNLVIAVSVILLFLFAREGKVGSALLQVGLVMALVGNNFDLYTKAQSLKSKPLAALIIWGWLATMFGLLLASFLCFRNS
ncbi:hypothetical protein IAD21_05253 [Abditibacteriota bacterium]|nr:hypothetical protein IAD21_05253 [Abditibacteriota bacterium]